MVEDSRELDEKVMVWGVDFEREKVGRGRC